MGTVWGKARKASRGSLRTETGPRMGGMRSRSRFAWLELQANLLQITCKSSLPGVVSVNKPGANICPCQRLGHFPKSPPSVGSGVELGRKGTFPEPEEVSEATCGQRRAFFSELRWDGMCFSPLVVQPLSLVLNNVLAGGGGRGGAL